MVGLLDDFVPQFIHSTIKRVWKEDIKRDYKKSYLLKEDTLKNSFYFHLRRRLGDFLEENNLRIFTEYSIDSKKRIDLVIVEIDPIKAQTDYLENSVEKVIAVIEMKYKNRYASDSHFDADLNKVFSYIDKMDSDTIFYLAFIREKYFYSNDVTNWVTEGSKVKGKLTEMLAYGDIESDDIVWCIFEH